MVAVLLFLILAVILCVIFSNMVIYVAGAALGILIVIIASIYKRRKIQ